MLGQRRPLVAPAGIAGRSWTESPVPSPRTPPTPIFQMRKLRPGEELVGALQSESQSTTLHAPAWTPPLMESALPIRKLGTISFY